jgi:predicted phosphate transport protein (TIGR00153 family)
VRLLPRDERFFDLFTRVAKLNVEAAGQLVQLLQAPEDRRGPIVEAIKRLEHDADDLTHEVVTRLDRSFITPLDREDIHLLASRLDDVLDLIDGTARRLQIFRAGEAPVGAIRLAEVIRHAAEQVLEAVTVLERNDSGVVVNACMKIKKLEEDGDSMYHEWMGKLFEGASDALMVMKWKEIYDNLEKTLDHTEDMANVLESISIKHA